MLRGHHCRGLHLGVFGQHALDLVELDPVAPQLELAIVTAEELQRTVRPPPCLVAGPVGALVGSVPDSGEAVVVRSGDDALPVHRAETLLVQLRAAEVSAGHALTSDPQLAGDTDAGVIAEPVDQAEPRMCDRAPDRR
ncbi:hypothetical protein [Streptomyces sp. RKAG290]|uniref:hypothetical protein n=1 Tax=Streptomyces sp. RKAG290 TaxID=2888348 RepID=UPI00203441D7|nr:hypothetical protein [Streptomyces sp. RKAG290]MCM2416309.1 hypothetical protein [Streptomyces sp. RKAG290]